MRQSATHLIKSYWIFNYPLRNITMKQSLEDFYDEKKWNEWLPIFNEEWVNSDEQLLLLKALNNNLEFAKPIWGLLGISGINWIKGNVPVLEYLTPLECLEDEAHTKRLKVVLMRLPV